MAHGIVTEIENKTGKVTSASLLDRFIESQKTSLDELQCDIQKLEVLKAQALVEPSQVLGTILGSPGQYYLRHSVACERALIDAPDLDWSCFAPPDDNTTTASTSTSAIRSSRHKRIRSEITAFSQSLEALPPLPAHLLEDSETKGKKRKRAELSSRSVSTRVVPTGVGGLRLPSSNSFDEDLVSPLSNLTANRQSIETRAHWGTSSSPAPRGTFIPATLNPVSRPFDHSPAQQETWKMGGDVIQSTSTRSTPSTRLQSSVPGDKLSPTQPSDETSHTASPQVPLPSEPAGDEELPVNFKKNWSLEEQHTLERLLGEIPSTVKFRWVKISEAMGGTRTPRQVASRVQKYFEKMKKLGVVVDSSEMGGGGRGGSKATQDVETPVHNNFPRTKAQSTRGISKTGPQYTKSGRRR